MDNYLEVVKSFKTENSSIFAQETSEECLLMFVEHFLRKTTNLLPKDINNSFGNNICTDNECYCGKYKKGDIMLNCDGGCMYPGA